MVDSCESLIVITSTFPEQQSVYFEDNSVNVEKKQTKIALRQLVSSKMNDEDDK